MMIYYVMIVFYLSPDWKQAELVSIPVGPDLAECNRVKSHRVAYHLALGGIKGNTPECALRPAPK